MANAEVIWGGHIVSYIDRCLLPQRLVFPEPREHNHQFPNFITSNSASFALMYHVELCHSSCQYLLIGSRIVLIVY